LFTPTTLKILGLILGLSGTAILAFRITTILKALSMAVQMHDLNFQLRAARNEGRFDVPNVQMVGSSTHVETAEKTGRKLLILGFALQLAGGLCNVIAFMHD
jgi:hypothetical protein